MTSDKRAKGVPPPVPKDARQAGNGAPRSARFTAPTVVSSSIPAQSGDASASLDTALDALQGVPEQGAPDVLSAQQSPFEEKKQTPSFDIDTTSPDTKLDDLADEAANHKISASASPLTNHTQDAFAEMKMASVANDVSTDQSASAVTSNDPNPQPTIKNVAPSSSSSPFRSDSDVRLGLGTASGEVGEIPSGLYEVDSVTMVMPLGELLKKSEDGESYAPKSVDGRKVWSLLSSKGGAGSTLLARNMADALVRMGRTANLIDLSLQFGDLLTACNIQRRRSLAWLQKHIEQGLPIADSDLSMHESGFSVISQVGSLDDLDEVRASELFQLVRELGTRHDHIILEGMQDFSEIGLASIDCADKILVLTTTELFAVKRAKRIFEVLDQIGVETARDVWIVVTETPHGSMNVDTIRDFFNASRCIWLPFDSSALLACEQQKSLREVKPDSPLSRAIDALTAQLCGVEIEEQSETKTSLWQKLLGRAS